jgi:phage N-6-adenine-methyltransferase
MTIAAPVKPLKSNEWYTPSYVIEAAREVLGSIDLDPASCALANETVKATRYFTKDDDGLSKAWGSIEQPLHVWCNPPYGKINNKSLIALWVDKLINEYRSSNVSQAILLTTCDSDNQWFQRFWDYLICFSNHNVHFYKPNADGALKKDSRSTQMFGTVFTYLGPNESKFIEVFSNLGTVARRVTS